MDLLQEGTHAADVEVDEPVVHAGTSETAMVLGDGPPTTAAVSETLLEHVAAAHADYVREEFAALDDESLVAAARIHGASVLAARSPAELSAPPRLPPGATALHA